MVINMAKIMIIEDEKSINDLIMLHLKLVGHECIQAFDGNEAISSFEANKPDLILLDLQRAVRLLGGIWYVSSWPMQ